MKQVTSSTSTDNPRPWPMWAMAFGGSVGFTTVMLTIGKMISVLVTLVYHLPANFRIWSGDMSSSELTSQLHWWLALHAVRTAAGLVAATAAFLAVGASISTQPRPEQTPI
ncbi:MAG: hypothetical protein ACOH2F_01390 [Cellulomonas sp.]